MLDSMGLEKWIFAACAMQALHALFELNKSEMKSETLGAIICASTSARFKKELADTTSREGATLFLPALIGFTWLHRARDCEIVQNDPPIYLS